MKKIIALIAAMALLISMSACSSGKIEYYTDSNGTKYIVVRDSDGNITVNDSGKLLVYTLNENGKKQKSDNGEYIQQYVDFSGQLSDGRNVETENMKFTLPALFTADDSVADYYSFLDYDGEIFIDFYNDITFSKQLEAEEFDCESLLESFGSEVFSYEKYTLSFNGHEATVFKQKCTSSEYYRTVYFYFFEYNDGYYRINCLVNTDYAGKVDFDKFVKSVVIK